MANAEGYWGFEEYGDYEAFTDENGVTWGRLGLPDPNYPTLVDKDHYVDEQGMLWVRIPDSPDDDDEDDEDYGDDYGDDYGHNEEDEEDEEDEEEEYEDRLTRR